MKRASTRALGAGFVVVAVLAVLANGAVAQPGGAGPGNSATAQLCHKGGWQGAAASDGAHFANAGECTSHAAQGGTPARSPSATVIDFATLRSA